MLAASASESTSTLPSARTTVIRPPAASAMRRTRSASRVSGTPKVSPSIRQLPGQVLYVVVLGHIGGEVIHRHQRQQQEAKNPGDQLQEYFAGHTASSKR